MATAALSTDSLAGAIRSARPSMLCYAVPDGIGHLPRRIFGGTVWPERVIILAIALACPVAALVALVFAWAGVDALWNATSWYVLYYVLLNLALLVVPRISWQRLEAIAGDVESLIQRPDERKRIADLIRRTLRIDVQIAAGLVGALAGAAGAAVTAHTLEIPVLAAIPFEISIAITMFFGVNVVLWIGCGLRWVHEMAALSSVRFDSIDAFQSPGLREMYALITRAQWYATGGLVLALLPLVVLYSQTRASGFLGVVVLAAGLGSVAVVLLAYTLPPYYLHLMRERDKDAILHEIRQSLPVEIASLRGDDLARVGPVMDLFYRMQARPTGGLTRSLVTSLIASLTTLAATFLPLLLGRS